MKHERILSLVAIACLLVALTAGAAHRHDRFNNDLSSDGAVGSADCAVCMLAHAPSTASEPPAGPPVSEVSAPLPRIDRPSQTPCVLDRAPGSRAPPLACDA